MVKKKFSNQSSRLIAEQESLRRQQRELRQREALLERRLRRLPAIARKSRSSGQPERHAKAIYTTFAQTGRLPERLSHRGDPHPLRGASLREKRAARIKFIILVLVLSSLLISIWRSLPA